MSIVVAMSYLIQKALPVDVLLVACQSILNPFTFISFSVKLLTGSLLEVQQLPGLHTSPHRGEGGTMAMTTAASLSKQHSKACSCHTSDLLLPHVADEGRNRGEGDREVG